MTYLSKPGTQATRIIEPVLTQTILIPNAQHTDDWSRPDTKGVSFEVLMKRSWRLKHGFLCASLYIRFAAFYCSPNPNLTPNLNPNLTFIDSFQPAFVPRNAQHSDDLSHSIVMLCFGLRTCCLTSACQFQLFSQIVLFYQYTKCLIWHFLDPQAA